MAARLRNNFNNEHVMLVFKVKEPGGCSGDLVTTDDGKVSAGWQHSCQTASPASARSRVQVHRWNERPGLGRVATRDAGWQPMQCPYLEEGAVWHQGASSCSGGQVTRQ